jgi:glycosyltransferase involved in cell wall biosynthesis
MAFGIPVIATDHFAIPEMLEHDATGLLIECGRFDCARMFHGYVVDTIPQDFRDYVTEQLFRHLCRLVESPDVRRRLGKAALHVARTKFSFDTRNRRMRAIYEEALQ